ncbi:cytochrome-c peroxidase [Bdellovibrio svalbardensis]|uniref:C-type cytochrome n=1 Tax=Bdellovibrio svalbardensis TaxID=2972972 RepID=A0ABT6DGI7_9BACT|nr:cytochrome c peroxidase [Bdellovibrio svalbardensis]MDG0815969.1 c-type cytochrome [Bdellovibrio svalbardensis]
MKLSFTLLSLFLILNTPFTASANDKDLLKTAKALFGIIPAKQERPDKITAEQTELGRKLFFDYRLSKDGSTACVRCHQPQFYSTDRLSQSTGFNNNKGARNAQSILNLKYQTIVHWRNDRINIEEQALRAFTTPLSLGNSSTEEALKRLDLAGYSPLFAKAFPKTEKPLTLENAATALATYQRSLTTRAPFDKYLEGDIKAISAQAQKGLKEFVTVGCSSCHNGPAVGGRMMQKFGVFHDYWGITKVANPDKGRQDVTKKDEDLYIFKVPSLRNITETAPYFHDASAKDLDTAIRWMGKLQLNKDLSNEQVSLIKAFLESLKGELPKNFREAPTLSSEPYAGPNI